LLKKRIFLLDLRLEVKWRIIVTLINRILLAVGAKIAKKLSLLIFKGEVSDKIRADLYLYAWHMWGKNEPYEQLKAECDEVIEETCRAYHSTHIV